MDKNIFVLLVIQAGVVWYMFYSQAFRKSFPRLAIITVLSAMIVGEVGAVLVTAAKATDFFVGISVFVVGWIFTRILERIIPEVIKKTGISPRFVGIGIFFISLMSLLMTLDVARTIVGIGFILFLIILGGAVLAPYFQDKKLDEKDEKEGSEEKKKE